MGDRWNGLVPVLLVILVTLVLGALIGVVAWALTR